MKFEAGHMAFQDLGAKVARHKKPTVIGGTVGVAVGATLIALLFLLTYVWPWSVLVGCAQ